MGCSCCKSPPANNWPSPDANGHGLDGATGRDNLGAELEDVELDPVEAKRMSSDSEAAIGIDPRYVITPIKDRRISERDIDRRKTLLSPHDIETIIREGRQVARVLYNFEGNAEEETMDIAKGDVLEILRRDGNWWKARNMDTMEEGYIPSNFVALENSLDSYPWFHGGVGRADAVKMLKAAANKAGTFLIRESETKEGSYSLSILEESRRVRHYRIKNTDFGGCFLYETSKFDSLYAMVDEYAKNKDARMCSALLDPCPKPPPRIWDLSRTTRDRWEIPRDELELIEVIGKGNFGEVWRGRWKGHREVAVKTLTQGSMEPEMFLEEATLMKRLQHPKILCLYAVCTQEEPFYIISELMPNGSLKKYLQANRDIELQEIIYIATQVADGMWYIERERLIHRDLAARNVLMGENSQVKICDFGMARAIKEDVYVAQIGGRCPVKWTAPEALNYMKFTIKSDVWSFGILLVELTSGGQLPYPGMKNNVILEQLGRGYRHPQPPRCPDDLYRIMRKCWEADSEDRPTFESLCQQLEEFPVE